ncbi:MAG: rhodanese-like domain-containing protein [Candidatus Saccharibacteria bacterium]
MFGFGKKVNANEVTGQVLAHQALLIDVRSNQEWDSGHAKHALHLSLERILSGQLPTADSSKKVYFYCASGARASMATDYLRRRGFVAENLGGLHGWKSGGGAIEQ